MTQLYQQIPPAPVEARQWTPDTDPAELAAWCGGQVGRTSRHTHTCPPGTMHTCLEIEVETGDPDGKIYPEPGDWLIQVTPGFTVPGPREWRVPGTYLILAPEKFAERYRAVS